MVFALIIQKRACLEDEFLRINLPCYAQYAQHVPAGLPFIRSV